MRSFAFLALVSVFASVTAFVSKVAPLVSQTTRVYAKDQTVKDLNLEQMFDVFEKADNTVNIPKKASSGKISAMSKVINHFVIFAF